MKKQFNVKGKTYKIQFKKLDENHGDCDRNTRIISIDTSEDTKDIQAWTLAHELAHAYLNEVHLGGLLDDKIEDIICECVAELLTTHGKDILKY